MGLVSKLKSVAVVGAAASVIGFAAGWSVNGWRLEANFANAQLSVVEQYEKRQLELNQLHAAQIKRDTLARISLSVDLEASRTRTAGLLLELETARLTPVAPRIEEVLVPGECDGGQAQVVVANPFSADFVRLWNLSASDTNTGGAGEE